MGILEEALIGPSLILQLVDEYTLYCYYTEIKDLCPRTAYYSPIRRDDVPSFSFFEVENPTVEYLWKDNGIGESGDIFKLIKLIYNLQKTEDTYKLIDKDFELGIFDEVNIVKKVSLYQRNHKPAMKIRISSIPFNKKDYKYWNQFGIGKKQLEKYNVTVPKFIWFTDEQEAPSAITEKYCYAYRVGKYYQIYKPYVKKKNKFRNDLPGNYVFGLDQIPKEGEVLVIDKSVKDIMFCDTINIPAIAGKSETTMVPHNVINFIKNKFKRVYLMLDNDDAGQLQTEKYLRLYPWLIPKFLEEAKDKTDLCLKVGIETARKTIKQIVK